MGISGARPALTPLDESHKISTVDYDIYVGTNADSKLEDVVGYQKLVGKLIYLTFTRLDIVLLCKYLVHVKAKTIPFRGCYESSKVSQMITRFWYIFPSNTTDKLIIYCDCFGRMS